MPWWGISLAVSLLLSGCGGPEPAGSAARDSRRMVISGAWALYPLVVRWAEEYQRLHPAVAVDVSAGGAGKGMTDALAGAVDLGMISREIRPEELARGVWWVSVARDAVVVTINAAHPRRAALQARGVRRGELVRIWITGEWRSWNPLMPGSSNLPIRLYTRSDACGAAQTWAAYLGGQQEDLAGVGVYGDPGLAEAVRADELGMGYNNINFVYDRHSGRLLPGLALLPLDQDENGSITADEDVYDTLASLTAAIGAGSYPSPPARDLHLVSAGPPRRPVVRAFLCWILTAGQTLITESGYISVGEEKIRVELAKLEEIPAEQ
ncbi:MAG: substrate-binding domain-containing protein [Acidobacteria bacterium]|nr:substrate-binding domain-containing protein [Acidobacteriota bacterium]